MSERSIAITRVSADFEREPLIRPFGFKGGYQTEIWQSAALLKGMLDAAAEHADERSRRLKAAAEADATKRLQADLQRALDLQKLNDHVRPEEIALARDQLEQTRVAIQNARVRLDAVRLVIEG